MSLESADQKSVLDPLLSNSVAALSAQTDTQNLLIQNHLILTNTSKEEHEKTRQEILNALFQMAQWGISGRYPQGFKLSYHAATLMARKMAPNILLESLDFPAINDRIEGVPEAFRETFEWIFSPCKELENTWSNFASWLQSESGLYWINGKAGSGKSTLLKFIVGHHTTQLRLSAWAGSDRLSRSQFFFWKGGTALQKNHTGLLRTLLFETFSQWKGLLKIVLPQRLRQVEDALADHLYATQPDNPHDSEGKALPAEFINALDRWSHSELMTAFETLVDPKTDGFKFCFIIDGLDEFEGDHLEMIELFRRIGSSPRMKICVSSRPLNVYQKGFESLPGLRLQDFTKADIRFFVEEKLGDNIDLLNLMQKHPERCRLLAEKIVSKASGVFLWVTLVVKSLLNGLVNNDSMLDLEKRINLLPADLEDLYWHMLKNIDDLYKPRSSRFFQIAVTAQGPFDAIDFSFADEEDPNIAVTAKIQPMSQDEQVERIHQIGERLKSVCASLLELQGEKVQFLHRTVVDFFEKSDVKAMLQAFTAGTAFHPDISLLSSSILRLKWIHEHSSSPRALEQFWKVVKRGLCSASRADARGRDLGIALLDEFDSVVSHHWSTLCNSKIAIANHWTNSIPFEYNDNDSFGRHTFISYAVRYQLNSYLRNLILRDPRRLRAGSSRPLLDIAIPPLQFVGFQGQPAPQSPSEMTIQLLLQSGSDPNLVFEDHSPWQNALLHVADFKPSPYWHKPGDILAFGQMWTSIFALLLQYSADPNIQIKYGEADSRFTRSALAIIRDILAHFDPAGAGMLEDVLLQRNAIYVSVAADGSVAQPPDLSSLQRMSQHQRSPQPRVGLRTIATRSGDRLNLYRAARRTFAKP
jgi:hypothetical protein